MNHLPSLRALVLPVLLLTASACFGGVGFTSQRVAFYHNTEARRLTILIFYDGVYAAEDLSDRSLDDLLRGGKIYLPDISLSLRLDDLRRKINRRKPAPAVRAFARAYLDSVHTRILGRYTDPECRLGIVKLITIDHPRAFLRACNGVISQSIIRHASHSSFTSTFRPTILKIIAAAKADHQWLTLEGHALWIDIPVHPRQAAVLRANALARFIRGPYDAILPMLAHLEQHLKKLPPDQSVKERALDTIQVHQRWLKCWRRKMKRRIQTLAAAPIALDTGGGRVRIRLGDPAAPSVFRIRYSDEDYQPNLEKKIIKAVPARITPSLAYALLHPDRPHTDAIAAIINWGPPEAQVLALLQLAGSEHEQTRRAALRRLQEWAGTWNQNHALPPAPEPSDDTDPYLNAWKDWYKRMIAFPTAQLD